MWVSNAGLLLIGRIGNLTWICHEALDFIRHVSAARISGRIPADNAATRSGARVFRNDS